MTEMPTPGSEPNTEQSLESSIKSLHPNRKLLHSIALALFISGVLLDAATTHLFITDYMYTESNPVVSTILHQTGVLGFIGYKTFLGTASIALITRAKLLVLEDAVFITLASFGVIWLLVGLHNLVVFFN